MTKFTQEEKEQLYAPFSPDEHEVREGPTGNNKVKWFTYVRREAIIHRLDELFFGEWELTYPNCGTFRGDYVDVTARLTIRGISREYNGTSSISGEHGAKSAQTDAFKRVASMWGIGLYLQNSADIWTDYDYVSERSNGRGTYVSDWNLRRQRENEAMAKVHAWLTNTTPPSTPPSNPKPTPPTPIDIHTVNGHTLTWNEIIRALQENGFDSKQFLQSQFNTDTFQGLDKHTIITRLSQLVSAPPTNDEKPKSPFGTPRPINPSTMNTKIGEELSWGDISQKLIKAGVADIPQWLDDNFGQREYTGLDPESVLATANEQEIPF